MPPAADDHDHDRNEGQGQDFAEQPQEAYAAAGQPPARGPEFVPSPEPRDRDQAGDERSRPAPPPARAAGKDDPRAAQDAGDGHKKDDLKKDDPGAGKPAPKAHDAQGMTSGTRTLANLMLLLLGSGLTVGIFFLGRAYAPPKPPGETAEKPPADMAKVEDVKKNTDQLEKLRSDFDNLNKQMASKPDYGPEISNMRNQLTALSGTITDFPARFDSMAQKVETLSRTQLNQSGDTPGGTSPGDLARRIGDLSRVVDNLRTEQASRAASGPRPATDRDVNVEGEAMEQAVDFYKKKKFNEARDAFRKLQTAFPDDARVWYYSALSNGFATGDWLNETVRLVNVGMEKEKAGQPDKARIDALFGGLTPATGRDWLADYRGRVKSN